MQYKEITDALQKLKGIKVKQREIAGILGVRVSVIGQRASRGSSFSVEEINKICRYYNADLFQEFKINNISSEEINNIIESYKNNKILNILFPLLLSLSEDSRKTVLILAQRLKIIQDKNL